MYFERKIIKNWIKLSQHKQNASKDWKMRTLKACLSKVDTRMMDSLNGAGIAENTNGLDTSHVRK